MGKPIGNNQSTNNSADEDLVDDDFDFESLATKNRHRASQNQNKPGLKKKAHEGKRTAADARKTLLREAAAQSMELTGEVFNPTYQGSRHEQEMILNSLSSFYKDHIIADVLSVVKSGKEATVYRCKAHAETGVPLLAAKIYRPRMFRNLKNDAMYRIGTTLRDSDGGEMRKAREQRAVSKRSKVGLEILHSSWLTNELNVMRTLHAAGAIVPKPLGNNENTILMEFLGDGAHAAPPLESVSLDKREAQRLFKLIVENLKIMLANGLVHGDLSAFNILYWEGQARIIDFPQAMSVEKNPNAYKIFVRDVTRVCDYFERYDITPFAPGLARGVWEEVMHISVENLREVQHARIEKAKWGEAE